MKLSFNEAKLSGLWARNCAAIQQVWILKFAFGSEKFSGLSRNRPLDPMDNHLSEFDLMEGGQRGGRELCSSRSDNGLTQ